MFKILTLETIKDKSSFNKIQCKHHIYVMITLKTKQKKANKITVKFTLTYLIVPCIGLNLVPFVIRMFDTIVHIALSIFGITLLTVKLNSSGIKTQSSILKLIKLNQ